MDIEPVPVYLLDRFGFARISKYFLIAAYSQVPIHLHNIGVDEARLIKPLVEYKGVVP